MATSMWGSLLICANLWWCPHMFRSATQPNTQPTLNPTLTQYSWNTAKVIASAAAYQLSI